MTGNCSSGLMPRIILMGRSIAASSLVSCDTGARHTSKAYFSFDRLHLLARHLYQRVEVDTASVIGRARMMSNKLYRLDDADDLPLDVNARFDPSVNESAKECLGMETSKSLQSDRLHLLARHLYQRVEVGLVCVWLVPVARSPEVAEGCQAISEEYR
eukprot:g68351.t1